MSDGVTVLVVDDKRALADAYSTIIGVETEYETVTAYSGEAGLARLDDDIDVLLVDRNMPDMSGEDLVTTARADGFDPRVVLVSGSRSAEDTPSIEYDAYLLKTGNDYDEILETLARVVNGGAGESAER